VFRKNLHLDKSIIGIINDDNFLLTKTNLYGNVIAQAPKQDTLRFLTLNRDIKEIRDVTATQRARNQHIILSDKADSAITLELRKYLTKNNNEEINLIINSILNTKLDLDILLLLINKLNRNIYTKRIINLIQNEIISNLIENGFARRNHLSKVLAKGKTE
jgi:hypothetical protein